MDCLYTFRLDTIIIVPDSYKEEYWSLHKEEYAFKTTRTERSTRKDI